MGDTPVPAPSAAEGMLSIEIGERDPYIDECPAWCKGEGVHAVASHEDDRTHHGPAYFVPVRSLPTGYYRPNDGPAEIIFKDAVIWLERPGLHRDPRIQFHVPKPETLVLSIEEAQQIADCLTLLVKESQR